MKVSIPEVRQKLDSVSSCFCLAKWTSVTLHLESGTTHSCHHPVVHEIPLEEIKTNPAAIHNTKFKIEQREKMIAGIRPSECAYCWRIEDLKSEQASDRYLKSACEWSIDEFDTILKDPYSDKYQPRYLEVSFSHTCQFKCNYCSADYSTAWEEDIKKHGPYRDYIGNQVGRKFTEAENPYIEAFWKWWPEINSGLHTFRITGGEPLLSPNTFKVLESLIEQPQPKLALGINTNLGAPAVLIEKFLKIITKIETEKLVKEVIIYTSIDAYGERADYIRNGLKHEYFWSNVEKLLTTCQVTAVTIMCTFNALSITSFKELFLHVVELNKKYKNEFRKKSIIIDVSYLYWPEISSVKILPASYIQLMQDIVDVIDKTNNVDAEKELYKIELIKTKRLVEWMREPISSNKRDELLKSFYLFFKQHDERRNTNFLKTFPEMSKLWFEGKRLSEITPANNKLKKQLSFFTKKGN